MYPDYLSLVIEEYETKLAQGAISQRLINPTPAGLRDECFAVCHHRYHRKDQGFLATFFGERSDRAAYLKAIEIHDIDKFRPLINYLNKLKTSKANTNKKNIELLAWLVDYEDRPYIPGKIYTKKPKQVVTEQENAEAPTPEFPSGKIEELIIEANTGTEEETEETEATSTEKPGEATAEIAEETRKEITEQQNTAGEENKEGELYKSTEPIRETVKEAGGGTTKPEAPLLAEPVKSTITFKKQRIAVLAIVFISSLSLGSYWLGNKNSVKPVLTGKEGCMYWTGEHYEQIPCNQKMDGVLVVALDAEKLAHFKKITNTDTITAKSKGWVWYTKIDNVVEFFTSDGYHPIQYERRLRPVTDRIIDRYVQRK